MGKKKKEFKVGEKFQCGLYILQCVEDQEIECNGCFFLDMDKCLAGECAGIRRSDDINVKFIKVGHLSQDERSGYNP